MPLIILCLLYESSFIGLCPNSKDLNLKKFQNLKCEVFIKINGLKIFKFLLNKNNNCEKIFLNGHDHPH